MIAPVARAAVDVIAEAGDDTVRSLIPSVQAAPHRLSAEALRDRVRPLLGGSIDEVRAGLQTIANEIELHDLGYDTGYEDGHAAGYDRAINDAIEHPEAFTKRLQQIRPEAGR